MVDATSRRVRTGPIQLAPPAGTCSPCGGAEEGVGAVVTTEELLVRSANQSLLTDMLTALTCTEDEFDRDGRDDVRDSDVRGGDLQVQDRPAIGIRQGFVLARREHFPPRDRRWCCFEWQARARPCQRIGVIPSGGGGGDDVVNGGAIGDSVPRA